MDIIGIIPARLGSTRLANKVLADINGKPMIQHVWEKARQTRILNDLIIAADDERIVEVCKGFGANVILTSKDHKTGTDRLTEIVNPLDVKVIVNIQGDEPLIQPEMIDHIARPLLDDEELVMTTLVKKIDDPAELSNPSVVKVVFDRNNFALYFSRAKIPYFHGSFEDPRPVYYKHIGMYGYTKDFLFNMKNIPQSSAEKAEKLEQLRVLEAGFKIKVIETKVNTVAVDTQEDLDKVRNLLK